MTLRNAIEFCTNQAATFFCLDNSLSTFIFEESVVFCVPSVIGVVMAEADVLSETARSKPSELSGKRCER
ncbi:MAG: hypothetical protein DMG75_08735 [Acidobacteria bacterium]|nr:MAG: hypothetical protein DMG75_08735 [Acidobacteriota bacterium]